MEIQEAFDRLSAIEGVAACSVAEEIAKHTYQTKDRQYRAWVCEKPEPGTKGELISFATISHTGFAEAVAAAESRWAKERQAKHDTNR